MSDVTRSHGHDGSAPDEWRRTWWGHAWWVWCLVLIALGVACTLSRWGASMLIGLIVTATLCVTLVAAVVGQDQARNGVSRNLKTAMTVGLAVTAVPGLVAVLGVVGLILLLLTAGTAPVLTAWAMKQWKVAMGSADARQPDPSTTHRQESYLHRGGDVERIPAPQELEMLEDAELCLAWRRSFLLLERSTCVIELMSIVKQRQEYLDELQRRSPQGIAAWLDAGARASSNPLPYLSATPHRPE